MRIVAIAALLAGCTTVAPEGVPGAGGGVCKAAPVQNLVGQRRSEAVGADALRRSGARTLRWIAPDSMITQDLREDRINIDIDASGRITGLRCF